MQLRKLSTTIYEYLNEEKNIESNLNSNFWKWFDNSKIVDLYGKPLVVYHGSKMKFDNFDVNKIHKSFP